MLIRDPVHLRSDDRALPACGAIGENLQLAGSLAPVYSRVSEIQMVTCPTCKELALGEFLETNPDRVPFKIGGKLTDGIAVYEITSLDPETRTGTVRMVGLRIQTWSDN